MLWQIVTQAGVDGVPFIPEEKIDQMAAVVDDLRDAVRVHTQALLIIDDRIKVAVELLTKIHTAVTRPAEDSDGLGDLLRALVNADERNTVLLQQVLVELRKR